ncbi:MAG: nitroreductase [Patescibacteria group bacterium]|nr:MAG: nitroreductase [Patescibacteria group bacterium]
MKNKTVFDFYKNIKDFKFKNSNMEKSLNLWRKIFFKEYPRFKEILLPIPKVKRFDIFQSLLERKSHRNFVNGSASLNDLSLLLYFSCGIKSVEFSNISERVANYNYFFNSRMYPSGGARFPLEVYLVLFKKIDKIECGVYHYNVKRHSLIKIKKGRFKKTIKDKILLPVNKKMIKNSLFYICVSSYFGRSFIKYGELSLILSLIEAGHLGQNLCLLSTVLNLGCCPIHGFYEDEVNKLLDLNSDVEEIIYSFIFGRV